MTLWTLNFDINPSDTPLLDGYSLPTFILFRSTAVCAARVICRLDGTPAIFSLHPWLLLLSQLPRLVIPPTLAGSDVSTSPNKVGEYQGSHRK
jgi:hypothetical protein